jgi:exodeoxyribonuclease-3
MKIISYNVNGIRAALTKDWIKWLKAVNPDIVCLQETKAQPEQIDTGLLKENGYETYMFSAQKKGYSGVAILTKQMPNHIEYGCGIEKYDNEGRIIRADYDTFSIISAYFPSGGSGEDRQAYKMDFLADFQEYINELKKEIPNLIISGDYNICHKAIDIHNPVSNKKSSGFLPEEREWLDGFINSGFIDSFRYFNDQPHLYTWWTYRFGARGKNLGWRIDYHMVSEALASRLNRATILSEAIHSDHCPILLEIN